MTLTAEPAPPPGHDREPELPRAPTSHRIPYEPALDGLRGLAVAAVVLYHGGVSWMTGGFLGVDAFFVLSGYLITSLLLGEWMDRDGIDLKRFWMRRVRRLLPALLIALVLVAAFSAFAASSEGIDQIRGDGLATLTYVMNWRLIVTSQSYFFQFSHSPLLHTWSLAIEEQYYLIWPLITLAVLRFSRTRGTGIIDLAAGPRRLFKVCVALFAASALWMFLQSLVAGALDDPSRLYYGTDTRAQSLLIGSGLAAAVAGGLRLPARYRSLVLGLTGAAAVILVAAWITLPWTNGLLYRGGFTLLALGVALVIFTCTQLGPNPMRQALSVLPLRALGLISYGLYLYHYPIYVWLDPERTGLAADSLALLLLRLAVSLGAAILSYYAVERPIRLGALGRMRLRPALRNTITPVAIALVIALLVMTTRNALGPTGTPQDVAATNRPAPTTAGSRVLLVGDSVAYRLGVGFEGEVSDQLHLSVWNQAVLFCELIDAPHMEQGQVKAPSGTCANWAADWKAAVTDFKPDVSVLELGAWEVFDREIDGVWVKFGTPEFDAILLPKLRQAIESLSTDGTPVAVLTTPRFERTDPTTAQEWTVNEVSRTDHLNDLLRTAVDESGGKAHLIDLGAWVCPDNECRTEIDGVEMRPDGLHFSEQSAVIVARWLAPQITDLAPAEPAGTAPAPPG